MGIMTTKVVKGCASSLDDVERDRLRKSGRGWRATIEVAANADKFALAQALIDLAGEVVKTTKSGLDS